MRPSFSNLANLACLTLLVSAAACGGDSGGPPSPPVMTASTTTTQTADAGAVVTSPSVRIARENGTAISRAVVTFAVSGGGTLSVTVDTTDASGVASAGQWRLGNTPGTSTVTATTPSAPGKSVVFTATGNVGPAASVTKGTGDGQVRQPGEMVSPLPSVTVRDAVGNAVAGATVTFAVTAGGGAGTGLAQTTDANGLATVSSWTLGTTAGQNRMTATVGSLPVATFTATVVAPSAVIAGGGNNQVTFPAGTVTVAPSVVVLDNLNAPVVGLTVNFAVGSGGGVVSGGSAVTNASGVATVTGWRLGDLGTNTLIASVAGLTPVTFNAVATSYDIELRFRTTISERQRIAFENAVRRWRRVVIGDQPDIPVNVAASTSGCFPAMNETIDDMVIYVDVVPIDGVNGVLGQAGPCLVRGIERLTVVGRMQFDVADLGAMETNNTLDDVIMHEMGHVLGIGTLWTQTQFNLLVGGGTADPYFNGANARTAFADLGGSVYLGTPVPVENTGGAGTRDGHWRETTMRTELMTGFISSGGNPMSGVTIASLRDMGYLVNMDAADPYGVPGSMSIVGPIEETIQIHDVLLTNPEALGPDGRIVPKK